MLNDLPEIELDLVRPGQVRLVFLPFPLEKRGDESIYEAAAAQCAGLHGGADRARRLLFQANSPGIGEKTEAVATEIGLPSSVLANCVQSAIPRVGALLQNARQLGIRGTPTFLFGTEMTPGQLRVLLIREGISEEPRWFQRLVQEALDRVRRQAG